MPNYVAAVVRQIRAAGERWSSHPVSTVYFGGGTPSLLPIGSVADLVEALRSGFDLTHCVEFSLEANPGTVSKDYLCALRTLGIDRLSLGVQSADDAQLSKLGRIHRWQDAVQAVEWSREAGFDNLSLDLLFGLPAQSLSDWHTTLERVLALEPEHLSLYGLSIEEGTPLAERIRSGAVAPVDDDVAADMLEFAEDVLADAGFFHYEISNWARTGAPVFEGGARWWPHAAVEGPPLVMSEDVTPHVCHHNLTYWRNQPWLGLGAAAYSWMPPGLPSCGPNVAVDQEVGHRWANPTHPVDYVDRVLEAADNLPCISEQVEAIDRELEMGETMMLGLRLAEGVCAGQFHKRFGRALSDVFGRELRELRDLGLVTWDGVTARLTARGRFLGNRVFERFI
jgi:oxygen-independent coproporphyrinogen-3 oxidase